MQVLLITLRKILLQNSIYYVLFIIILIITLIRISIPKKSIYTDKTKYITGIITNKIYKDETLTLNVKSKEIIIVKYYTKQDININIGDTIKVYR